MIEVFVTLVEAGQVGEDNKKAYRTKSPDERKVQCKEPVHQINGPEDAIEDHKDQLSNKDDHIEAIWESIPKIDESVTKVSTTMLMRRELINLAVSRSNSFHTPKSHDIAPKADLSSEDHVYVITRRYLGAAGEQVPRCRTVAC